MKVKKTNAMKKVFQLHDKFTEEIIGAVLLFSDANFDDLWNAWTVYHNHYNSNTTDANLYDFENQYGKSVGFEVIEVDFIQL